MIGASLGALILGMTTLGIQFAGWDSTWRFTFFGVILFLAVLVNLWIRKRAEGRAQQMTRAPPGYLGT